MLADPETPVPVLAQRVYDADPPLMAECQKHWALERIAWMLYRNRQRQRMKNHDQLRLPGFELLPRLVTLKDGTRKLIRYATLAELEQYRNVLGTKHKAKIAELERLIALVKSFAGDRRNVTVDDALVAQEKAQQPKW
jgi:hypothetical protein